MFKNLIKNGFTNFFRNIWLSTAATLIMVITLAILTVALFLFSTSNVAIRNAQQRIDISVYFKQNVSEQQILSVKSDLEKNPEVAGINYVSAADAVKIFRQRNASNPQITQSLDQFTTSPLPATLQVKAKSLDQYSDISQIVSSDQYKQYVDHINFNDNRDIIDRISRLLGIAKSTGIGLVILFSFIAVIVIFNTIRLTIYNRKEEVEIMRLVGATNWYIRLPFIIESILYALIASIITMLLMLPIFSLLIPKINAYFELPSGSSVLGIGFGYIFLLQLGVALVLGIFSSLIAIRRYLKV